MKELYVLYTGNQHSNLGITLSDPCMLNGYYLTGYHHNHGPIKIGEIIEITFAPKPNSLKKETKVVKVIDIKDQFWDGKDMSKNVLTETIPSYKNFIKFITIDEVREEKINEVLS